MNYPNDLFIDLNPKSCYIKRKSNKSLTSEIKNIIGQTLSTSSHLKLDFEYSKRKLTKESNYSSNSYSLSNQSSNSQNENESNPVKTIIVTDNSSDKEEENKNIPIEHLNETSSFVPISPSNDFSNKSNNTNSLTISRIATDKITFKNINCENSIENLSSKNSSLYSLKSPLISNKNSNESLKKNKTEMHKNFSYFCKENKKNIFENLTSQISSHENIQQLEEKCKNDNLLNEIPILSKKILLSNYQNYLKSNLPIVYPRDTDNKIINGFSAFTYKNDSSKIKTKISININLNNSHGIFNLFSLYNPIINIETLNNKYQILINSNIINIKNFFNDITGEFIILTFHNNIFYVFHHEIHNINKFYYKALYSIDNSTKITYLNIEQKIRIQKNFDFLILFNKGVSNFLSNKELCIIIYKTMRKIILKNESFESFLEKVIKNFFNNVIQKGGKKDMACIFICFSNLKQIFEKKNINKIDEILIMIENTSYNEEYFNSNNKNDMSVDSLKLIITPSKIGTNKCNNNISFKEEKSLTSVITQKNESTKISNNNNSNKKQIQKKTLLNCCGFFC